MVLKVSAIVILMRTLASVITVLIGGLLLTSLSRSIVRLGCQTGLLFAYRVAHYHGIRGGHRIASESRHVREGTEPSVFLPESIFQQVSYVSGNDDVGI
jgi:hypothetical protein